MPSARWQCAEESRHRSHHDGTETQQAGFVDGIERRLPFLALGLESEVNHHDGVFLHNTNEENDADERNDAELHVKEEESKDGAHARGRKRGENGDGVNIAFVEDAENDVNGDESSQDEDRFVGE